jgi:hypothetical protein
LLSKFVNIRPPLLLNIIKFIIKINSPKPHFLLKNNDFMR